jgi:hypothetical protein
LVTRQPSYSCLKPDFAIVAQPALRHAVNIYRVLCIPHFCAQAEALRIAAIKDVVYVSPLDDRV